MEAYWGILIPIPITISFIVKPSKSRQGSITPS